MLENKTRGNILIEAHKTVNGERQSKHGTPEDSFGTISEYWNTYIKSKYGIKLNLGRQEICEMMSLFKHARMAGQGHNPDNHRDAAGYLGLADDFNSNFAATIQTEKIFRVDDSLDFVAGGGDCGVCDCSGCDRDYIAHITEKNNG